MTEQSPQCNRTVVHTGHHTDDGWCPGLDGHEVDRGRRDALIREARDAVKRDPETGLKFPAVLPTSFERIDRFRFDYDPETDEWSGTRLSEGDRG